MSGKKITRKKVLLRSGLSGYHHGCRSILSSVLDNLHVSEELVSLPLLRANVHACVQASHCLGHRAMSSWTYTYSHHLHRSMFPVCICITNSMPPASSFFTGCFSPILSDVKGQARIYSEVHVCLPHGWDIALWTSHQEQLPCSFCICLCPINGCTLSLINSAINYSRLLSWLPICLFSGNKVTLKNKAINLLPSRRKRPLFVVCLSITYKNNMKTVTWDNHKW